MSEHPVFIPHQGERLAAIVSVPEGRPRGLVLLLQGLGAPRSHKYGVWTRTARALADRSIASVRFDDQAIGDSTGPLRADLHHPPAEEAIVVANTTMDILGVESVAAVGNCMGARTALTVGSRLPGCISVACILPGNVEAIMRRPPAQPDAGPRPATRARRLARKVPGLKNAVRRVAHTEGLPLRIRFVPEFLESLDRTRLLLLFLGGEESFGRLKRTVDPLAAAYGDGGDERLRTRRIPAGHVSQFRLPITLQPLVIQATVDWIDETLPEGGTGADRPMIGAATTDGGVTS